MAKPGRLPGESRDAYLARTKHAGKVSASQAARERESVKEAKRAAKEARRNSRQRDQQNNTVPSTSSPTSSDLPEWKDDRGRPIQKWYDDYRNTSESKARRTPLARSRGAKKAASKATLI